jgi:hypothetical protein
MSGIHVRIGQCSPGHEHVTAPGPVDNSGRSIHYSTQNATTAPCSAAARITSRGDDRKLSLFQLE